MRWIKLQKLFSAGLFVQRHTASSCGASNRLDKSKKQSADICYVNSGDFFRTDSFCSNVNNKYMSMTGVIRKISHNNVSFSLKIYPCLRKKTLTSWFLVSFSVTKCGALWGMKIPNKTWLMSIILPWPGDLDKSWNLNTERVQEHYRQGKANQLGLRSYDLFVFQQEVQ